MKLWGWWRSNENDVAEGQAAIEKHEARLLEDLAPKFEDDVEAREKMRAAKRAGAKEAIKSISLEDFKHMNQIPCFRQAMLTGIGIGAVTGGVVFLARRPVSQASNWGMIGFLVGSAMIWEQCRFRIRQGKRNVSLARQSYAKAKQRGEQSDSSTESGASSA